MNAPDAAGIENATGASLEELQLATRNSRMPLEALDWALTPIGLHYLLIHYDIPRVDARSWSMHIGGRVERPLELSLDELRSRPARTSCGSPT